MSTTKIGGRTRAQRRRAAIEQRKAETAERIRLLSRRTPDEHQRAQKRKRLKAAIMRDLTASLEANVEENFQAIVAALASGVALTATIGAQRPKGLPEHPADEGEAVDAEYEEQEPTAPALWTPLGREE